MGDPRRQKKKYVTPKRPFDSDRFEQELQLVGSYGLRNKRELWKHRTKLSHYRRQARNLLALAQSERGQLERELVQKLARQGILKREPALEQVLDLTIQDVLERRLQTIVFRKGLACSVYHSRQLVTHGHVALDGARVSTPSRIITVEEEEHLDYAPSSSLNDSSHPARIAAGDIAKRVTMHPEFESEDGHQPRPITESGEPVEKLEEKDK